MGRKYAAEFLGTILLVFFGAGAAALVFGYRIFGSSLAAGILLVAITFGLIYAALVYVIGPISGGHVNPAVTLGAFISRRIGLIEAAGYWVAQLAGGIVGALLLWWMMRTSPLYSKSRIGLGANGYGANSILHVIGIPFDGASVNPARSLGPALVTGGSVLSQVWVFLVAPMVGGVLAAVLHFAVHPLPASLVGRLKRTGSGSRP